MHRQDNVGLVRMVAGSGRTDNVNCGGYLATTFAATWFPDDHYGPRVPDPGSQCPPHLLRSPQPIEGPDHPRTPDDDGRGRDRDGRNQQVPEIVSRLPWRYRYTIRRMAREERLPTVGLEDDPMIVAIVGAERAKQLGYESLNNVLEDHFLPYISEKEDARE